MLWNVMLWNSTQLPYKKLYKIYRHCMHALKCIKMSFKNLCVQCPWSLLVMDRLMGSSFVFSRHTVAWAYWSRQAWPGPSPHVAAVATGCCSCSRSLDVRRRDTMSRLFKCLQRTKIASIYIYRSLILALFQKLAFCSFFLFLPVLHKINLIRL